MDSPAQILRRHGLRPKHSWGQNFLSDPRVLAEIARACSLSSQDAVVELGAGLGHLTLQLAKTGARVVAVERDRDLVAILEAELQLPNVSILAGNAAAVDFRELAGRERCVVVGNLPYHLSSSILFEVLHQRASVSRAIFMLQREVAERLSAQPGSRDYGLLSVLLQLHGVVEVVLDVPRGAFLPPPEVESAVVRIDFAHSRPPEVVDDRRFELLVKSAFQKRRKALRNAIAAVPGAASALVRTGIDGSRRPETLTPREFAQIEREIRIGDDLAP